MKNIKKLFLIIIILLNVFVETIYAEEEPIVEETETVTIHLKISTDENTIYNQSINVEACDSGNPSSSTLKITAYCAVLQSGVDSDWNFDWAPGIFLNSINDIVGYTSQDANGSDVYHYWSWYLNSDYGTVGLNQYELQAGDSISLVFVDPIDETEEETETEETHRVIGSAGSSTNSDKSETKKVFDINKAFEFLIAQQKENGSWNEDIYTDWTALAIGTNENYLEQKTKLINYLKENQPGELLTDYERYAMALMSLNLNPYNINNINYIKKITDSFDGKQFGDKEKDNDDIFALIVLQNTGYTQSEEIIKNTITFILSKQKENGSWDESVDMTGASMVALSAFNQDENVKKALEKAKEFLKEKQEENGGWNNVSSTAWAIEGILALSEKPEDWIPARNASHNDAGGKNDNSPLDYLAENQDTDGGIKDLSAQADENLQNRIWQTAYVASALSGKTWTQIMQKFEKIKEEIKKDTETKTTLTSSRKVNLAPQKTEPEITNANQNTTETQTTQTEIPTEKGWFKNFLDKIFSIF